MKSIVLFTGGGIADFGHPISPSAVVDIEPWFLEAYRINHPQNVKRLQRDILATDPQEVCADMGVKNTDLLWGSPSCQCFSISAAGLNPPEHARMRPLYLKTAEYAAILKPRFVIVENVLGILQKQHVMWTTWLKRDLEKLGYYVALWKLNAIDFDGCAQRKRVFIVARLNGPVPPEPKGKQKGNPKRLGQIIGHLSEQEALADGCVTVSKNWQEKLKSIEPAKPILRDDGSKSGYCRLSMDGQVLALRTRPCIIKTPLMVHPKVNRFLSVREFACIQGVPDYKFPKYMPTSERYRVIGQAIPPFLAKAVIDRLTA